MWQLCVTVFIFSMLPLLSKKMKFVYTLLVCTLLLGILSGIGPLAILESAGQLVRNTGNLFTILAVLMVCVLSGLMGRYRITNKLVDSVQALVGPKVTLMLIPAIFGTLIMPGGAILSAPFIDKLGADLHVPPVRRVVINLVYRHVAIFVVPFATSLLILPTIIPDISVAAIIVMNAVFMCFMLVIDYFLYMRDIQVPRDYHVRQPLGTSLKNLLVYASPIWVCLALNLITGLPFCLVIWASVAIVYILGDRKDFLRNLVKSVNPVIVGMVAIVLTMKEIVGRMDGLMGLIDQALAASTSHLAIILVFAAASIFLGLITGYEIGVLAVTLPLVAQMGLSGGMLLVYVYMLFSVCYIGYYFSPLHMCQLFTAQYMKVETKDLYREYRPMILSMAAVIVVTVAGFWIILT